MFIKILEKPISFIVIFLSIVLLGIASMWNNPISLLPDIEIPELNILINTNNYSVQESDNLILKPIKNQLSQINGLKSIECKAEAGSCKIKIFFNHGTNMDLAYIELNEKIDLAMNSFPRDISRPISLKSNLSDIPILQLAISFKEHQINEHKYNELSEFCSNILKRRIEQIPEIAMADITGKTEIYIGIIPKKDILQTLDLNIQTISEAINKNIGINADFSVVEDNYQFKLKIKSDYNTINKLHNLTIIHGNRILKLSDVAEIKEIQSSSSGHFLMNSKQAISIAIIKSSKAKVRDLKIKINNLLHNLEQEYPELEFNLYLDNSKILDNSIDNLTQDLILGAILAITLMLVFYKNLYVGILIAIAMPISLVFSQLLFYLFGISVNIISLGGLLIGLSMIIDNSIVVIDSIKSNIINTENIKGGINNGILEIIRPLITSVLTNCAVFIPLIFLSGLAGDLFYEQALSIVLGIISSILVSIFLIPLLFYLFFELTEKRKKKKRLINYNINDHLSKNYERILFWSFRNTGKVLIIVFVFISIGVFSFFNLEKVKMPYLSEKEFEMDIEWNKNLNIIENNSRVQNILSKLSNQINFSTTWIGKQQYILPIIENQSSSQVKFYFNVKKPLDIPKIQKFLQESINRDFPNAIVVFKKSKNPVDEVYGDKKEPIEMLISKRENGQIPDISSVLNIENALRKKMNKLNFSTIPLNEYYVLNYKNNLNVQYGISLTDIVENLNKQIKLQKLNNINNPTLTSEIFLGSLPNKSIADILTNSYIITKHGEKIQLSTLLYFTKSYDYKHINSNFSNSYYPIKINTNKPNIDFPDIQKIMSNFNDSLIINFEGSYFENLKLLKEMGAILIVSVILLYFILAAQFESLIQPLFVLIELPIAIFGSFILLYLFNNTLNIMSMIGIIIMSGIIINDSILKIDSINRYRKIGYPVLNAIVRGGQRRLKSIVMISLVSLFTLLPTIFMEDIGSEIQIPLVLSLIGGMLSGLLISLFIVPIIYHRIYKNYEIN